MIEYKKWTLSLPVHCRYEEAWMLDAKNRALEWSGSVYSTMTGTWLA
jgi:hypothetical protein